MNSLPSAKYGIAPNEIEKNLYYQKCIETDSTLGVWERYQSLSTDTKDTKEINIKKRKKSLEFHWKLVKTCYYYHL